MLRRWQLGRLERLVREEVRDLQDVRNLSSLQLLVDMLPARVGSLLSVNSLREDLQVAHKTAAQWLEVLEHLYHMYRIYPFARSTARSLKKEAKLYLWDWSEVPGEPARVENLVASHLLKFCHYLQDSEGYKVTLHHLRDADGREVDFLVAFDGTPWIAVEVKSTKEKASRHLLYFGTRLAIPYLYQVVDEQNIDVMEGPVRIMSLGRFLGALI
ncbi:MAG: DUF4143 domain-containing protein [Candidatus Eremiobacteraeota bacterium]|nr:DUF4143 domain-containing protein [Candidatus Eremiobacteraeota bacterium]